jgi:type II secretory pathway pseudopilin PulG
MNRSNLKGTRPALVSHDSKRADPQNGFTLVAVVIGIAILTILIAAVAPSIGVVMKRDREAELIFRGRQYARAVGLFQRRYGRYPNQLKELYENRPRTIRHLWKDPMCNCDFQPLIQGMPCGPIGVGQPPGAPPGAPQFAGPSPTPTPAKTAFGSPTGQQVVGPIVGVRSSVHKEGLQEWRGQKFYDQWCFIVGDADRDTVGNQPGQGLPIVPLFPTPGK